MSLPSGALQLSDISKKMMSNTQDQQRSGMRRIRLELETWPFRDLREVDQCREACIDLDFLFCEVEGRRRTDDTLIPTKDQCAGTFDR